MNTEFENEYYVPKTYAETAMEVIKNDWEDRKSKDCKKYTQERVAELMNISRIQFARALTQDKDPSITFICSYANAVGADIKELMMEIAVELDRTQRQTLAIASRRNVKKIPNFAEKHKDAGCGGRCIRRI